MSVPIPLDLSIAPPPVGWTAQAPNQIGQLATLVASLLSGQITASFLIGQVGGSEPATNLYGPWANGNEWWFWDITTQQYQPSQQGCPIGTIAMWCLPAHVNIPSRWLRCFGQMIPISTYPRLYNAVEGIWGQDATHFRLPPPAVMFLNAANFVPASGITVNDSQSPDGQVFITGGSQTAMLKANQLPACKISIPFVNTQMIIGTSISIPDLQQPGSTKYSYPVTDENGVRLGAQQQALPTLPPVALVHFIIKYM